MKKAILFVFILSSVLGYSQDTTQAKEKKAKRFFFGVNFSPDYCFRTLKNNNGNPFNSQIIAVYNKVEIAKPGFSAGASFYYIIKKHISIDLGIQYSNKGFQEKEAELTFGSAIDRRRGFVYNTNNSFVSGKIVFTYNYLDIPLKVNLVFGKKKTRFIGGVGLTTNILMSSKNTFIGKDSTGKTFKNSGNTTSTYNRINFSPTISCGVEYKINKTMFFRIEPTFRYGVLKMTNTPVTQYIWNAGINLSWYFL